MTVGTQIAYAIDRASNQTQARILTDYLEESMRCNQCEALMINGVYCHETGCPNSRKTWDENRGEWLTIVECRECGFEYFACDTHDCESEF